jgi:hypothetical protein
VSETYDPPALLTIDYAVLLEIGEIIQKHLSSNLEINAVLSDIAGILRFIPLEAHRTLRCSDRIVVTILSLHNLWQSLA